MSDNELKLYRAEAKEHSELQNGVKDYKFLDFWYAGNPLDLIGSTMPCTRNEDYRGIKNDTFIVCVITPLANYSSTLSTTDNVIGNFTVTK